MDLSGRSGMQSISITVGVEDVLSAGRRGKIQEDYTPRPWQDSLMSIELALVKTQRTELAAILDEAVIGNHYLPRHLEIVPSIRGRNNQ
ncbi:hypothetical protein DPMN_168961 [Dreissena polymorpha]|uniref:Uncharacterized protein n=1 Tax=Dreissena polymorpha TaxID=45954 RepID=A0A9D4F3S4_DREPO|nr:hypothetical protein DPMN_168961 [Dreissena polymorpha]